MLFFVGVFDVNLKSGVHCQRKPGLKQGVLYSSLGLYPNLLFAISKRYPKLSNSP